MLNVLRKKVFILEDRTIYKKILVETMLMDQCSNLSLCQPDY